MNPSDWEKIKHFGPHENWGNVDLISFPLILELDAFRDKINTPIFISCGTQGKHLANSYHYQGLAVDILFPEKEKKDLPNLFIMASRFKFSGIGIYPDWEYLNEKRGGMHLDLRPTALKAMWVGIEKNYLAVDFQSMYHLFVKDAQV